MGKYSVSHRFNKKSDIVSLLNLPRKISEYNVDHIGEIVKIPYNDLSKKLSLVDGCIEFEVVAINHHTNIKNATKPTITLMTKNALRYAAFDAKEPQNSDSNRCANGNNRWGTSNIRQYLNSNGNANEWFTPQHEFDTAPDTINVTYHNSGSGVYSSDPGFLAGFSDDIKEHFAQVKNKTYLPELDKAIDGNDFEETLDYVFLPSRTELGVNDEGLTEGSHLSNKFVDKNSLIKLNIEKDIAINYLTRSPKISLSFAVHLITKNGENTGAYRAYYGDLFIAPIIVLF
jgi:hypothetical protein